VIDVQPKFISFDCYGTLAAFGMSALARRLLCAPPQPSLGC
jgi:2-haloacid dehalogenase